MLLFSLSLCWCSDHSVSPPPIGLLSTVYWSTIRLLNPEDCRGKDGRKDYFIHLLSDTRETCSMLHALVTINEESLVPQFFTLKLLFISLTLGGFTLNWPSCMYRYLHQYKHNISRYLQSINKVSGVGLTARDCRGLVPAPRHHRSRSWGPLVTGHTFTDNCPRFQIYQVGWWCSVSLGPNYGVNGV